MSELLNEKVDETLNLADCLFGENSDFNKSLLKEVEAKKVEAHMMWPIRYAHHAFQAHMEKCLISKCESPIEQMMAIALYSYATAITNMAFNIKPQEKIDCSGKIFRVDFLLEVFRVIQFEDKSCKVININIVIECDGHDYHERTKEQAQRDKEKDRILQSYRYYVLRFTGSEIYKNPFDCVYKVFEFILQLTESLIETENRLHFL